jgi:hypothetical protein
MTTNDLVQALLLSEQTAWQEEEERVRLLSEQTAWQEQLRRSRQEEEERVRRLSEQTALKEEQRRISERRSQLSIASWEEREHLMNRVARLESSLNREKTDYKFVILVGLITWILTQIVSRVV